MKVQSISGRNVCTFRREPPELEALELERTASVARYIYNWGLACCQVQLRRAQRHLSRAPGRAAAIARKPAGAWPG